MVFFFNDTATTEIYTLSLHDALPICLAKATSEPWLPEFTRVVFQANFAEDREIGDPTEIRSILDWLGQSGDRKSTRLNSSHANISYAVFCLKKKKKTSDTLLYVSPTP